MSRNPAITMAELLRDRGYSVDWDEVMQAVDHCAALVPRDISWPPTSGEINELPTNTRRYIHDLETRCDPGGDVRRMAVLETENSALRKLVHILETLKEAHGKIDGNFI